MQKGTVEEIVRMHNFTQGMKGKVLVATIAVRNGGYESRVFKSDAEGYIFGTEIDGASYNNRLLASRFHRFYLNKYSSQSPDRIPK